MIHYGINEKCMKFVYDHSMCLEQNFIYEMCMIDHISDFHTRFMYEILFQTHTMIIHKFHTFFLCFSYKIQVPG